MTILVTIIIAVVSLIGNALVQAYFYGRLTEKVAEHGRDLAWIKPKVEQNSEAIAVLKVQV